MEHVKRETRDVYEVLQIRVELDDVLEAVSGRADLLQRDGKRVGLLRIHRSSSER